MHVINGKLVPGDDPGRIHTFATKMEDGIGGGESLVKHFPDEYDLGELLPTKMSALSVWRRALPGSSSFLKSNGRKYLFRGCFCMGSRLLVLSNYFVMF